MAFYTDRSKIVVRKLKAKYTRTTNCIRLIRIYNGTMRYGHLNLMSNSLLYTAKFKRLIRANHYCVRGSRSNLKQIFVTRKLIEKAKPKSALEGIFLRNV